MTRNDLSKRLFAEWFGTLALVATVVGSGIMAETLANNNVALALLGNTIATGAILVVLITMLGPVSGAHFNPAVSAAFALKGALSGRLALFYIDLSDCWWHLWHLVGALDVCRATLAGRNECFAAGYINMDLNGLPLLAC